MALPLSLHHFPDLDTKRKKAVLACLLLILATGLFLTKSWAAVVALLVSCSLVILRHPKRKWRLAAIGGIPIAFALVLFKFNDPELLNRLSWWSAAYHMSMDNPLWGVGLGAYESYQPHYIMGSLSSAYVHNWPLQIMAESGIPGLILLVMLMAFLIRAQTDKLILCAVIGVLLHNMVDYGLAIPANALTFWCLLAMRTKGRPWHLRLKPFPARFLRLAGILFVLLLGDLITRPWLASRHLEFGKLFLHENERPLALRELKKAVSLNPLADQPYAALSRLYLQEYQQRDYKSFLYQALTAQEKAIQRNPAAAPYWIDLGLIQKALGQPENSRHSFHQAITLNPRLAASR